MRWYDSWGVEELTVEISVRYDELWLRYERFEFELSVADLWYLLIYNNNEVWYLIKLNKVINYYSRGTYIGSENRKNKGIPWTELIIEEKQLW